MLTTLRLSAATTIVLLATNVVAHAEKFTRYNFKGEVMPDVPEPTTSQIITSWLCSGDALAILIAFFLPGRPNTVFLSFAFMTVMSSWQFAVFFFFFYYLLQFLMGGKNNAYE
jgi:hypothetical protein